MVKREFSAGGAVYRQTKFGKEWLLIRPKDKDRWQLPKGLLDPNESTAEAAIREVREEGGAEVNLIDKIDTVRIFFHWPPKHQLKPGESQERVSKAITFYLMEAVRETKEGPDKVEVAETKWLPFEEAVAKLTFKGEKEVLRKAKEMVELTQTLF